MIHKRYLWQCFAIVVATFALIGCGSHDTAGQTNASAFTSNLGVTSANDVIDTKINKTEMLADLSAFFKAATLGLEDQQQIKSATLREARQPGRLPNFMAGETVSSPAVLASAKADLISNSMTPMNFLNSTPVYRFYNLWTNVHFYTANEAERANIIDTAPHFRNEGTAFFASSILEPNTLPVYRFYNYGTGAHFYTINQTEKDSVVNTLSQYYRFEGIVWYANPNPDTDLIPVYRFYNFNIGAHFYTASSTERAYVLQTFPFMRDEGIAYYVAASRSYTIGGSLTGLAAGKTVVLTLNGTSDLSINSNSSFMFGVALSSAQPFVVTVKTQPVGQTCSVANGSGTLTANVANIVVTCSDVVVPVTVGGTVTGLSTGNSVVLSLNGGSDLSAASNTGFTFAGTIMSGQTFAVTVKAQPTGQTCSVTNGSGTAPATNVTNVAVSCLSNVTINGTVSGLNAGKSVTVRLNGVEGVTVSSNTGFGFTTILTAGQPYSVLISTQPVGQICSVANGTGTVATSNVTNVAVTCVTQVKVGGTVTGLGAGKTVTLTLNGSTDLAVISSSFQFPTVLTTGQLYSVVIKTQSLGQTCSISNNSGTAASTDVTNVAVTCVNNITIGGTLSGMNVSTTVTLTLNGGSDLTLSSNGSFTFATTVPDAQVFAVVVKTQPVGQTCSVTNGNATAAGNMTNVAVSCVNNTPTGLMISEVASCPSGGCWFEVFNPTGSSVNLSAYSLKTQSSVTGAAYTFALPSLDIAPNAYAIVLGNPGNSIKNLNLQTALINDTGVVPYWLTSGFIELISNSTAATVDFVKFGTNAQAPTTAAQWVGAQAPALTASGYGYSIVRMVGTISTQDSNSAVDWTSVSFTTPGGQNDVPAGAVDSDGDGIPDSSELPGSTYAGMDLYSMGARQGVRDIFVEIDHMNSADPGVIPRTEALQKVVDAFAAKGITLHFDAGTQFSASFSTANFNLGQGNSTVVYEKCVEFISTVCFGNTSQFKTVYDWKLANFELRRKNIFHYMLFGNSQLNTGAAGSSGRAEISGNDSIITLGSWGLTTLPDTNRLINYQAGTIMHEFGHNLGLQHGGNEDVNYKPNYYSVMNYLYQLGGLAQSATSIGPFQRWAINFATAIAPSFCSMLNSACGSPSQFIIDYSNGSSTTLNENSLSESANIGRGADVGIFADWNSSGTNDATNYARDINNTASNSVLTDFNDWGSLYLAFHRGSTGQSGISSSTISSQQRVDFDPMSNDQQPASDCTPSALWLRLAMQSR
jgi:Repeat of unknown function (DUF5648)